MNIKLLVGFILLLMVGCGGSSNRFQVGTPNLPAPTIPDINGQGIDKPNVKLVLEVPASKALAGDSFTAKLVIEDASGLKQASLRLLYNTESFTATAIRPGNLIPASALFLSSTNAGGPAYEQPDPSTGVIPIAFTLLPGQAGISQSKGVLAEIDFSAMKRSPNLFKDLYLQQSPEYLIFGNAVGETLAVTIEYKEAGNV